MTEEVKRFFIIDMGNDMVWLTTKIEEQMKENKFHYLLFLTDMPSLLCVEEVNEDTFLDFVKQSKN